MLELGGEEGGDDGEGEGEGCLREECSSQSRPDDTHLRESR